MITAKWRSVIPVVCLRVGNIYGNQLPVWAPDPLIRKKILVDNPVRLYAFS